MGFYELLEKDILRFVEEYRSIGRVSGSYNSIFHVLILKKESPNSFDDFNPISLCNCIFKIIDKIIYLRINNFLSKAISYA